LIYPCVFIYICWFLCWHARLTPNLMCDTTHLYLWRGSFMCVTHVTGSFICEPWISHSNVWHEWVIYMCDMNQSHVSHRVLRDTTNDSWNTYQWRIESITHILNDAYNRDNTVVLQIVAVCCSACWYLLQSVGFLQFVNSQVCCSVLRCVAVYCRVLQCVAVCCSVFQCVAVCCSVLPCVAVLCSMSTVVTQGGEDTTHPHVWHDSFIYVKWLIHIFDVTLIRDVTHVCVTWIYIGQ